MTKSELIKMLQTEKECVERQDIPCDRRCEECDLCMPTEKVIEGYDMAISELENNYNFVENNYNSAEQTADNNSVLDNIRAEIDKLPRIKVGNSNSPTVKYCIDERLLYKIIEGMKEDTAESDGDLISRKETIEWLKKVTVTDGITFETGFEQILVDIEQMPSAENTAEWIIYSDSIQCSNCKTFYQNIRIDQKHYCQNCGAKMREEE